MAVVFQKSNPPESRSPSKLSPFLKIGLLAAFVLHVVGLLLFQTLSNHLPDRKPIRPYVTYISNESLMSDTELEEYALLFDSAPLFIPTQWSASQSLEIRFDDITLRQFTDYEPQIELLDKLQPANFFLKNDLEIKEPSDLLASPFWLFFEGFGQSSRPVEQFESVKPLAEIFPIEDPLNPMVSIPVDLESATPLSLNRPVSYTIQLSEDNRPLSKPTLWAASGNEALDQLILEWLQDPKTLAQLPSGYLLIRVFFW